MATRDNKDKTEVWEVAIIALIWLMAISLVYIIFWKARIVLNF